MQKGRQLTDTKTDYPPRKILSEKRVKRFLHILAAATLLLLAQRAEAQFYSWGADPASLRWRKIKDEKVSVIFPDSSESSARRMLHYIHSVQPSIGYGFTYPAMKVPFIIHPENFRANGMVMYLPKRVEILSIPAIDSYSMPWLKQLTAHEYRHAVQYSNLDRGVVHVLSYIIGQQSSTFGLLFLPLWLIEGDAVMSETQMSSFGRGLQPSFTIDYRALGNISRLNRNTDKWFCGSYKDNVPDHYHIGYQIASYTYTKYNGNIWDKVAHYSVRNPYLFATTAVSLKKFYGTSVIKLTRETFDDLAAYWESLPEESDTSQPLPRPLPQRSYTTYRHPLPLGGGSLLSLKTDLDRPSRFVVTDMESGNERRIAYTGSVSTRPDIDTVARRVWWTEYRRSTLFAEKVNSTLCYMDLGKGRTHTVRKYRNVLYPTVINSDTLAWVEYEAPCRYSIVVGCDTARYARMALPQFTEVHGLAYDNRTSRLCFITTDDDGMRIGAVRHDEGGISGDIEWLTEAAYITLSNLRAGDGVLYFGSIASGKDEVHALDLVHGGEYRVTTSAYGSFDAAADGERLVMTTYDKEGYHLASQRADTLRIPVEWSALPENRVNPPRVKWDVVNLDTVRFTAADEELSHTNHRSRRYSKPLHLFNIHSWAPASYSPFEIIDEGVVNFNLGATIISQNLLSDSEMFLTYGWNRTEGSVVQGSWRYYGLGVNFALSASYGGKQRVYTIGRYNPATGEIETPELPDLKKYYSVSATASLPLLFQSGYHTRYLGLSASWNFSNGLTARVNKLSYGDWNTSNLQRLGYDRGLHTLQFGITYQDVVQQAHKDFAPKWGVAAALNYAVNPETNSFSSLLSTYARVYLPGVAAHHSLSLAAAYQTSLGGFSRDGLVSNMSYRSARLLPNGYNISDIRNRNYVALSASYQLPLCYPDGGIPSVLYFKRIRLNLGFGYAGFDATYIDPVLGTLHDRRKHIFSGGADLTFDINLFRQPAAATSAVTISAYVTREGKPYLSAGLGLPF